MPSRKIQRIPFIIRARYPLTFTFSNTLFHCVFSIRFQGTLTKCRNENSIKIIEKRKATLMTIKERFLVSSNIPSCLQLATTGYDLIVSEAKYLF